MVTGGFSCGVPILVWVLIQGAYFVGVLIVCILQYFHNKGTWSHLLATKMLICNSHECCMTLCAVIYVHVAVVI